MEPIWEPDPAVVGDTNVGRFMAAQGIDSTPSFLIGPTGDKLDLIKLDSSAPAAIEGRIESAIAAADQR